MDSSNTDHGDLYRSNSNKRDMKPMKQSDEEAPNDLWDSLESDTESLVQEKAYQRELQKRILNGVGDNSSSYNDDSHNPERSEHEDACDLQPDITEIHGGQNTKFSRHMPPWDDYADLRYDPDWRRRLARSEFPSLNFSIDSNDDPREAVRQSAHMSPREIHKYLLVHSPVSSEIDTVHLEPLPSSFHLHPPEDQDTVPSVPQSSSALASMPRSVSDKTMNVKQRTNNPECVAAILPFSSSQQRQQAQSQRQHDGKNRSIAQEKNIDKFNIVTMQRRHSQKIRPTRPREDIVERNKATLGMNTHKQGSYLKAYVQKEEKPDDANQPLQSDKDTASTDSQGSPDNVLNPELIWIQKTQKLKTHNQNKHLDRARPHHHITKSRDHLNQPVKKQHSQTPSEKQTFSPPDSGSISQCSFSSAPTVNINLTTTSKLTETLISPELQKQLYTVAFPSSPQRWIRNDEYNSCFKRRGYTLCLSPPPAGTADHESMQVTNKNTIRIPPTQPSFQKGFSLNAPQPAVHYGRESMDSAQILQTYSGAYPVLPPIGGSNESDTELCSGRPEAATNTLPRSRSEGYLAQLEKQKQVQAKTTYKVYTLSDYKSLNRDVKLGGLGPSNTLPEDVAEKIRQQKLYSNVIRVQNKKISRIPCVVTKNLVGSEDKNNIPRNKALEYAKTIVRPKAPQQLKKGPKDQTENGRVFEHSDYLQFGVDLTQLSTLQMLKKRHEQEKQVVACFRNILSRSSVPSDSSHQTGSPLH